MKVSVQEGAPTPRLQAALLGSSLQNLSAVFGGACLPPFLGSTDAPHVLQTLFSCAFGA